MAAIDDNLVGAAISARVEGFYESHPYPPPLGNLAGYASEWDETRRRADACLFWPDQPYREDRHILVAGCGTSQAAKYAMRWPRAHITGIDFSKASIAETAELKRKHDLHNLELHELPVERAADLGRTFDYIICTGVLHHLPDPESGLRALGHVLAPGGAMHLMLYAPYGRAGIYMLQDYCRRLGIGTSSDEIRQLAESLGALPTNHPLGPLLRNAPDFATEAGLADALLHPRDRSYSVPELFEFLASAGLSFGRWLRQAAYMPSCGAVAKTPHCERLMILPAEEQYAALELFRGCMVEHSVVAYADGPARPRAVRFDGEDWLEYIPVRVPDTLVVEQRLPAGAVAVLINPRHTFTDLYLPLDAGQKSLFDLIDGGRSIGQIVMGTAQRNTARSLFEQLWQYDQIVFDASRLGKGRV